MGSTIIFFLGTAAVALFTFLSVSHWITTRSAERMYRERLALFRKALEQPEHAALLRDLLREEDARALTQVRQKAREARYEDLKGGATLVAVGAGLSIFLYALMPSERVWPIGILIILIGAVTLAFAYFRPSALDGETSSDE
jgi:hypothetical protein